MDFKKEIADLLANTVSMSMDEIYELIEIPPDSSMGDYAFPCFKLAKELKKAPPMIAKELVSKFEKREFIIDTVSAGPYINFFVNKEILASQIISSVISAGDDYGKSNIGEGKTIVIDYSSPNIAKQFHIGHIFTTVIGNSLYKIHKALGYRTVGINYLGDWGTQFGKMIVAYKLWGNDDRIKADGVEELNRLYVKYHDAAETDATLGEQARAWLVKMQENDAEAIRLWTWFKELSLKEYAKSYQRLGITFDSYNGEAYYNDKMMPVVDELREKELLVESDGAMIVDLEKYKMPPCLILRTDGGTLYPTRDIAAAMDRKKTYNFYKCLVVTDMRQSLHFAQFFKVIELMGYEWAKDLVHIPYGLVGFEDGALSTRHGKVILLEDLFDEARDRILDVINEKNTELPDKESVAEQVGIGAVIFSNLYNSRIKDVTFSWEKILSFEGETGPYVQYTHARACSVLEKAGDIDYKSNIDFSKISDAASTDVLKLISNYNDKLLEVSEKYEPYIISRYLMDLSQAFNKFYHNNSIINSDVETKKARLSLVYCAKTVLASALGMLGIKAPEKM